MTGKPMSRATAIAWSTSSVTPAHPGMVLTCVCVCACKWVGRQDGGVHEGDRRAQEAPRASLRLCAGMHHPCGPGIALRAAAEPSSPPWPTMAAAANFLLSTLSPIFSMAKVGGPTHVAPADSTALANTGFSLKKPGGGGEGEGVPDVRRRGRARAPGEGDNHTNHPTGVWLPRLVHGTNCEYPGTPRQSVTLKTQLAKPSLKRAAMHTDHNRGVQHPPRSSAPPPGWHSCSGSWRWRRGGPACTGQVQGAEAPEMPARSQPLSSCNQFLHSCSRRQRRVARLTTHTASSAKRACTAAASAVL